MARRAWQEEASGSESYKLTQENKGIPKGLLKTRNGEAFGHFCDAMLNRLRIELEKRTG